MIRSADYVICFRRNAAESNNYINIYIVLITILRSRGDEPSRRRLRRQ